MRLYLNLPQAAKDSLEITHKIFFDIEIGGKPEGQGSTYVLIYLSCMQEFATSNSSALSQRGFRGRH